MVDCVFYRRTEDVPLYDFFLTSLENSKHLPRPSWCELPSDLDLYVDDKSNFCMFGYDSSQDTLKARMMNFRRKRGLTPVVDISGEGRRERQHFFFFFLSRSLAQLRVLRRRRYD